MNYILVGQTRTHSVFSDSPIIRREDVLDIETAFELVDEAEKRAGAIEASAKTARVEAERAGHAEGYAAGQQEAEQAGAARLAEMEAALQAETEKLRRSSAGLAIEIVRRIAGRLADDCLVAALADEAVRELVPDRPVAVRVHPDQAEAVAQRLAPFAERVAVEADADLPPSGCVLVSHLGRIDAGLETQLAAIERALTRDDHGD